VIIPRQTRARLGKIILRHEGSYAIRQHPTDGASPAHLFVVDRWCPVSDLDRDMISQHKETREEWVQASPEIWFGFEGEGMVFPEHIFEYYNLVVVRPKILDKRKAVEAISEKLG